MNFDAKAPDTFTTNVFENEVNEIINICKNLERGNIK